MGKLHVMLRRNTSNRLGTMNLLNKYSAFINHIHEYKQLSNYQTECECDTYPKCECKPIDKYLRERYEEEKDTE